jgi:non-ribosomal peptide synthetase component E (peptide arylation enzyme)
MVNRDSQLSKRIGIVAANNTGYVEAMLSCLETGDIAVPLRHIDDQYRINAANITQVVTPTDNGAWTRRQFTPSNTREIALISFTSGTEGVPKGVALTHNNLADVVTRLNSLMQLDDSISEYIGVPVYHSFGFGRCRAVATAGGKFFLPSNGFNPSEISEMLNKGEINAISAVPSLWRVLLANKDVIGSNGRKVRWIEIGSQYMSRREKEEMKALFPEARIVQHYGLTEASRTTLLQIHEVEGELLESVGQALGSVEIKQTLEGQIAIRGNHVALYYLIDGQDVALQDEDGWFLTKDLGSLENGYLYYKGRADDVINCGGIKVSPEALETKIYASIGCSSGLAICRKMDSMRGEGFLLAVTQELNVDKQQLREAAVQATQELGVNAANAITIIDVDSLPKTATGKIQRKQLAQWYALQSPDEDQSVETTDSTFTDGSPIQAIFRRVLNVSNIRPQDSFISLGGDSLSYIQFSMQLENYLGNLPPRWEQMPLKELERLVPHQKRKTAVEIDVLLRAIAICGVVFNHTELISENYVAGTSLLLLIIAGLNFARFQGYALSQGKLESILPIMRSLVMPYFAINLLYQLWHHNIDLTVLLMFNNFLVFSGGDVAAIPFPYWFICLLVQILVVFYFLFLIKPLRDFANSSPWRFGLMLLIVAILTNMISTYLWYSHEFLYPRVPHILFWLFALGWCLHFAESRSEKLATTGILLVTMSLMFMSGITSEKFWILIGGTMLLWVPFISAPPILKSIIQTISAATYYIYMTHMFFIQLSGKLGISHSLINTIVGLLGSLLIWFSIQRLREFITQYRSGVVL